MWYSITDKREIASLHWSLSNDKLLIFIKVTVLYICASLWRIQCIFYRNFLVKLVLIIPSLIMKLNRFRFKYRNNNWRRHRRSLQEVRLSCHEIVDEKKTESENNYSNRWNMNFRNSRLCFIDLPPSVAIIWWNFEMTKKWKSWKMIGKSRIKCMNAAPMEWFIWVNMYSW